MVFVFLPSGVSARLDGKELSFQWSVSEPGWKGTFHPVVCQRGWVERNFPSSGLSVILDGKELSIQWSRPLRRKTNTIYHTYTYYILMMGYR
jgi:hypothetical protein